MSKSNATENDFLKMALQGTDPAWRASANVYVRLHTADPTDSGSQNTSEAAYTGYAAVTEIKASGWTDGRCGCGPRFIHAAGHNSGG